jgi:hypothetical protein
MLVTLWLVCPVSNGTKIAQIDSKMKKYWKVFEYMLSAGGFYPADSNVGAGPHKSWNDNASKLQMLSIVRMLESHDLLSARKGLSSFSSE